MNYLAHLHLGGQLPAQLLGSLYGDFVKGPLSGRFSPSTEAAIKLHRRIDAFTDSHPVVRHALSRFTEDKRRYAGIALDMFFDHCLATQWEDYSDVALEDFAETVYEILRSEPGLPPSLSEVAPLMISENWLCAYREIEMIGHGLSVVSQRLSRPEWLDGLYEQLQQNYNELFADFTEFYPQLRVFASTMAEGRAGFTKQPDS